MKSLRKCIIKNYKDLFSSSSRFYIKIDKMRLFISVICIFIFMLLGFYNTANYRTKIRIESVRLVESYYQDKGYLVHNIYSDLSLAYVNIL